MTKDKAINYNKELDSIYNRLARIKEDIDNKIIIRVPMSSIDAAACMVARKAKEISTACLDRTGRGNRKKVL